MKPLRLRKLDDEQRKPKEKERSGSGVPLAPSSGAGTPGLPAGGLGTGAPMPAGLETAQIGSRVAASIGSASPGASSGGAFAALVSSKAGVVALTLAVGTVAAGISLIGGSGSGSRPVLGRKVFDRNVESAETTSASQPAADPRQAPAGGSSLDYVAQANASKLAEADPQAPQAGEPALRTADARAQEAPKDAVTAKPPGAAEAKRQAEKPKMAAAKKPSIQGNSSLTSGVTLKAMTDFSSGINNPFQEVYKAPLAGHADSGAARRSSMIGPLSGSGAWDQAKFTNGMSKRAMRMSAGAGAAGQAGLPFDGGMALGGTSKSSGNGASLGASGQGFGASDTLDSRSVTSEAPPEPAKVQDTKNKTPYQGLVYAGIAALMMGQLLVAVASKLVQTNPAGAQAAAAAAMAAGGSAAGIGANIAGQYDQLTQGLPFMMGGGVIAAQAAMVLVKAQQAQQETDKGLSQANDQAQKDTGNSMPPAQPPQLPQGGQQGGGNHTPSGSGAQRPQASTPNVQKPQTGPSYSGPIPDP